MGAALLLIGLLFVIAGAYVLRVLHVASERGSDE
jgi:hypothetical protein